MDAAPAAAESDKQQDQQHEKQESVLAHVFESSAPPARKTQPTEADLIQQRRRERIEKYREAQRPALEEWRKQKDSNPDATRNPMNTVFVGRLQRDARKDDVRAAFSQYGTS